MGLRWLALLAAWQGAAIAGESIRYEGDQLTVHVVSMPIGEVLAELGRQTHATVRGNLIEGGPVTADFDRVPLPEALDRLFGRQTFALIYGKDGRPRTIQLLGSSSEAPVPSVPIDGAGPTIEDADAVARLFNQPQLVHLEPRVASALGAESLSVRQLFDLGYQGVDGNARASALAAAIAAVERDETLRSTWVEALRTLDETAFAVLLRRLAGAHAEEFAATLSARAKTPAIRHKVAAVAQNLRLKPPAR